MLLEYCIVVGVFGSLVASQTTLPTFQWLNEFAPFSTVPLLKISFPDGNEDDFAILKSYNPVPVGPNEREEDVDPCIFEGHLLSDPEALVTLTGCPFNMNFEVQFSSPRLSHDMFKVTEGIVEPKGRTSGKLDVERLGEPLAHQESRQLKPLNPNGYITNLKAYYDDNFAKKFGNDAQNAVRRILAHTQHMWKWPTITTKLYFNVSSDISYRKGDWITGENFRDTCKKEVPSFKDTGINTHIFFGVRSANPKTSTLGKAIGGGACQPSGDFWHCAMMEYEESDIAFARSLAHEVGHNHGIEHDFIEDEKENKFPRFDSKNNPCTHVHGIMDYDHFGDGDKSLWTTCSVEDLTKFINANPNCFQEANPSKPPTEIGLPGLTANECDLTQAVPMPQNGYRYVYYNGYPGNVLCIDGYCASFSRDKEPTACRRICGADSCKGAVNVLPCDLTAQLPGFTGSKKVNLNGNINTVKCENGMCYPANGEGYLDACMAICNKKSCKETVIPKPCTLELPDGETWICNAKPYFRLSCLAKQCEIVSQATPIQEYTDTCMRVCGKASCEGSPLKTC